MIALSSLTSCHIFKSPKKRAEYHMNKAQKLDPDIIKRFQLDTTIDVNIPYEGDVLIPEDTLSYSFNCDSVMNLMKSKNDSLMKISIINDSLNHVILQIDKKGNVNVVNISKPKSFKYKGNAKGKVRVIVHPYTYPVYYEKPFYKIIWFWLFVAVILLKIIINNSRRLL